jgi:hypothetical protein
LLVLACALALAGCGDESFELRVVTPDPTCQPEPATYQFRIRYDPVLCTAASCREPTVEGCLDGLTTDPAIDGEPVWFTLGLFDDAGTLIACARTEVADGVSAGDVVELELSCDIPNCPVTLRDSGPDCE